MPLDTIRRTQLVGGVHHSSARASETISSPSLICRRSRGTCCGRRTEPSRAVLTPTLVGNLNLGSIVCDRAEECRAPRKCFELIERSHHHEHRPL